MTAFRRDRPAGVAVNRSGVTDQKITFDQSGQPCRIKRIVKNPFP